MFDFKQIYCVNLTDGKYMWRRIVPGLGSPPSPRDKLSCWVYKTRWLKILEASCKASRFSWKVMNACMPDVQTPSCRLVYFGGYGHKLQTDMDSRNRSFIVDEASWVICHWCSSIHHFSLKFLPFDYLTLSPDWRCVLGMEQWGSCIWPNEFQLEWTKNKCKPVNLLWNGNDCLIDGLWSRFSSFLKFWEDFIVVDCVCRVALPPPGLPTPVPHWGTEGTFVEEESWWASFMAIYVCESKIKWQTHWPDSLLNAGNQDEWCSLSGLWDMDMDRNVRRLKCLVNVYQVCIWVSDKYPFQNPSVPHSSG